MLVGRRRATPSQTQRSAISLCHKSPSLPSHSRTCAVPLQRPESRCWRETVNITEEPNKQKKDKTEDFFFQDLICISYWRSDYYTIMNEVVWDMHHQLDTHHVQLKHPQ